VAQQRRLTAEHLYSLPIVSACALDSGGGRVAYVRTVADADANAYRGSVRVFDLGSRGTTVLTRGVARDAAPAWSSDGNRLFFLSDRSGTMQVWCIDCAGGEAYAAPAIDGSVSDFSVSPDGRFLAAVAVDGQARRDVEARGWRRITRQRYRADGIGYHDAYPRIWLLDLVQGTARALTDGTGFIAGPAWSPDGAQITYAGEHGADADGVAMRELWVMSVRDGSLPQKILTLRGSVNAPAWSTDGSRIAFVGSDNLKGAYGLANQRLFTIAAGGEPTCLAPSEEWTCGDATITDIGGAGAPSAPQWMADGSIAVLGTQRGATRIFVIAPDLAIREATPSTLSVNAFGPSQSGGFICCASRSSTPPELYNINAGGALDRLTSETKTWCEQTGVREAARLSVDGPAGPLDAWHLPSDVSAPRPCILQIHGGPHFAYGETFFFEFQLLAAAGYDVVYCNPRGSQGYGESFAAAIVGKWGGPALADCQAALDTIILQGGIDEKRLGVAGGSYGGYLTAWAIGQTRRFAAAVAMRSATNLESLWGTSEVGRMLELELGGTPAQIPEVYRRNSPITYADEMRTPLLLIHGERDYRCPPEQAEQLFTALYQRGRTVEFVRFLEADHGLSRGGPPKLRVARLNAIVDWFDRRLT